MRLIAIYSISCEQSVLTKTVCNECLNCTMSPDILLIPFFLSCLSFTLSLAILHTDPASGAAWNMLISPSLPVAPIPTLLDKWIIGDLNTLSFSWGTHPLRTSTTYVWGCSCDWRLIRALAGALLVRELLKKVARIVCVCVCVSPPPSACLLKGLELCLSPCLYYLRRGEFGVRGAFQKERLRQSFHQAASISSSVHWNMPHSIQQHLQATLIWMWGLGCIAPFN